MAAGKYTIWTADSKGQQLDPATTEDPERQPDPMDERAENIYFGLDEDPPEDQAQLQADIDKVLGTVVRLYRYGPPVNNDSFRRYYVRLFRIAQLGLGPEAATKQAKIGLATVISDLIDDEGLRIKNRNLVVLSQYALLFSLPLAFLYAGLTLWGGPLDAQLHLLGIARQTLANFLVLWIGAFVGVCLSYGVRTATFSLTDLTDPGGNRLLPQARLLFIGALTMLFGLLFVNGLIELKVGGKNVTAIASDAGLSFLIGVLFGMAEAVLPGAAAKKTSALLEVLK